MAINYLSFTDALRDTDRKRRLAGVPFGTGDALNLQSTYMPSSIPLRPGQAPTAEKSPYATFTDALMQHKRASGLRGQSFLTGDALNLQSAYMGGETGRAVAGKAAALSEQTLATQKRNVFDTQAQEKTLSEMALANTRQIAADRLAADKSIEDAQLAAQAKITLDWDTQTAQAAQLMESETARATREREAQAVKIAKLQDLIRQPGFALPPGVTFEQWANAYMSGG